MPIIPSEGEIEYRACFSLSCHNRMPISWVFYKPHKLIFTVLDAKKSKSKCLIGLLFGEGLFPGS